MISSWSTTNQKEMKQKIRGKCLIIKKDDQWKFEKVPSMYVVGKKMQIYKPNLWNFVYFCQENNTTVRTLIVIK